MSTDITTDDEDGNNEEKALDPAARALWESVQDDITERFGTEIDIQVSGNGGHLDIRILPTGLKTDLEAKHDDLNVVPYSGTKLTITDTGDDHNKQTTTED